MGLLPWQLEQLFCFVFSMVHNRTPLSHFIQSVFSFHLRFPQTGMVIHWKRKFGKGYLKHSVANILGAIICYLIILILLIFRIGEIWPFFPIIVVLMILFYSIKSHYNNVAMQLRLTDDVKNIHYDGNTVLILVGNITQASIRAINYAKSIGQTVVAMHVSTLETREKDLEMEQGIQDLFPRRNVCQYRIKLYRDVVKPTMSFVQKMNREAKKNNHTMTVIIPKFIPKHSWQNILHNQMSLRLRARLRGMKILSSQRILII